MKLFPSCDKLIKKMATEMIEIDGSVLEGGGQILRIALSLSALNEIPIRITKIRSGRGKPGIMEQHLKGIELIRDVCGARVQGAYIGSTTLEFFPGPIHGGTYIAAVKTAGSISLLLQVVLPCALFADSSSTFYLKGGTNAEMAPQVDYMTEVFRRYLEMFGATFDFDLKKRGYFPKGGGEVVVTVNPVEKLKPVTLTDRGNITSVYGWSFVAGSLPLHVAHVMGNSAVEILKPVFPNVQIERYKEDPNVAPDTCFGILLIAETDTGCVLGASALGNRNRKGEETAKIAAEELIATINKGCCVDPHSQDQIIILMALASGDSEIKVGDITMHTKSGIYIVEKLTGAKFEIVPCEDGNNIIKCSSAATV